MEKALDVAPATGGGGGGSVISTLHDEVVDESVKVGSASAATDDQLFEKIEGHLIEKINAGDKTAPFLLGQFYYEEVVDRVGGVPYLCLYGNYYVQIGLARKGNCTVPTD